MGKTRIFSALGLLLALMQLSCNDENEVSYELRTLSKEVYTKATFMLEVTPGREGWTFSSKNNNIATVNDTGLVTTHYVGKTMLYARHAASGTVDSVQVTVKPRLNYFPIPYLGFNASMNTVAATETVYEDLLTNVLNCLNYIKTYDVGYTHHVQYFFNSYGKYYCSKLIFDVAFSDQIISQVAERYPFVREKDCIHYTDLEFADSYYVSPDSSYIVTVSLSKTFMLDDIIQVYYHPYTDEAMETIQNDSVGSFFNTVSL